MMEVPSVTIDSNVVLDCFERRRQDACDLIDLHPHGVRLQVANRTPNREATKWAGRLDELRIDRQVNFFRLDLSPLNGPDVLAGESDVARLERLQSIVFPNGVLDPQGQPDIGKLSDLDILDAHLRSGAALFVTRDRHFLDAREKLQSEFGIDLCEPGEALERVTDLSSGVDHVEIDPDIADYYNKGHEHERLTALPSLELVRTQVLLERFLPAVPARVLDVGGGSGVYASWLSSLGYDVHLVDAMPLHVEQAKQAGGFSAALGDARSLAEGDSSYDAVLLLGPLYHLTERADRLRALSEARRVVRPGGVVIAVAISRYASTFDGYFRDFIDLPGFATSMDADLRTGQHRNPEGRPEFFTTSYFHDRAELAAEVHDAELLLEKVLLVEGFLHWAPGIRERLSDPSQRQFILDTLSVMEDDPSVAGATSHLLAVGKRAPEDAR